MRVVNIMNFVRGVEPRMEMDLLTPVKEEIKLNKKYGFENTFLLQYDVIINNEFVDIFKSEKDEKMDGYCIENAVFTEKEIIAWYRNRICRVRYFRIKEALNDGGIYQHIKMQMKGRISVSVVSEDTRLKVYTRSAECADKIMNLIWTKNSFAQLKYKSSENQTVQLSELKKYQ